MSEKKTYGQAVFEHHSKELTLEDDVIEYRRQMEPAVVAKINDTIVKSKLLPQYANKDFYIVLLFRLHKLGQAVEPVVIARLSCPTPIYKQSVWKYHRVDNKLEFLWDIPDQILYWHVYHNRQKYFEDKETADKAKFVTLMESGELLEWVKRENGEKIDAVIKLNQEPECLMS